MMDNYNVAVTSRGQKFSVSLKELELTLKIYNASWDNDPFKLSDYLKIHGNFIKFTTETSSTEWLKYIQFVYIAQGDETEIVENWEIELFKPVIKDFFRDLNTRGKEDNLNLIAVYDLLTSPYNYLMVEEIYLVFGLKDRKNINYSLLITFTVNEDLVPDVVYAIFNNISKGLNEPDKNQIYMTSLGNIEIHNISNKFISKLTTSMKGIVNW